MLTSVQINCPYSAFAGNSRISNAIHSAKNYIKSLISTPSSLERVPARDEVLLQSTTQIPDAAKDLKYVYCSTGEEMGEYAKKTFMNRKYRIATSGYSKDKEGYSSITSRFLDKLEDKLGSKNTGYVAPPTLDPKSIYDITARTSGLRSDKLFFVSSKQYLEYLDPEKFASDVNIKKFKKMPIYVAPSVESYVEGTGAASNVLVCTGGAKYAVDEITTAINRGNKVVLLINDKLQAAVYDSENQTTYNAAKYFMERLSHHGPMHGDVRELTTEFIQKNENKIKQLVRVYFVDGTEQSIQSAAERAAKFIETPTLYDFKEKYGMDISRFGL